MFQFIWIDKAQIGLSNMTSTISLNKAILVNQRECYVLPELLF